MSEREDSNIFTKLEKRVVVVLFFLFSILALMDKSHRQKNVRKQKNGQKSI
jgi:hypothetical protein